MDDLMVQADNLVKIYKTEDIEVMALAGLDLTVAKGELMAIIGNSGSGKSTFLNIIGGLDKPSAGRLFVDGRDLSKFSEKDLAEYKRGTVGFVWQNNARNLLPYLTAMENIMVPMHFNNVKDRKDRAQLLLEMVGMSHRKSNRLSSLSGGEQQRIAIAIALANQPKLLLADEPTGSVDSKTSDYLLDLFRNLNHELGITIIIVTHDRTLTKKVQRVVTISDGKISTERILRKDYQAENITKPVDWQNEETQDEYAVLDRAGRLAVPRDMLDSLNIKNGKVSIHMENEKIIIKKA